MARPGDWSALGLGGDPTPGDPGRIESVIAAELVYVELARDIDNGLTEVKNTASTIFVGKTAEALRGVIDGRLRDYISTFKTAHEKTRGALTTYVGVMRTQQERADAALTAAAALSEDDDAGRDTHKATAEDAKTTLEGAADTAARAINAAAESIASPVDECEEFWKALTWIAMLLALPAIIFGGPIALLAIALNVALLIKTAIDFAHGKASVTQLVLGVLGVIAPTTKGLHLGNLWKLVGGISSRGVAGTKNLFLGGANSLGLFSRLGLGIDDVVGAAGAWIKGGIQGLKLGPGLGKVPQFLSLGGQGARGIRFFPLGAELTMINLAGAKTFFGLRSVITTINAFKGLGASIAHGLSGFKGLRLFLPVAADEMGKGLGLAFKIGFIDRGVFGMYRYGAFIDGKFIGAGAKVSGGVNAGFGAFGSGGDLIKLPHINLGGLDSMGGGPLGAAFDVPPPYTRFAGDFGDLSVANIPPLGTFGNGFHVGGFPDLSTYLGNTGNLGALVPLTGFGTKIADIPSFSFTGLGTTNLAGNLTVPPGITGLGQTGLGALPPSLGHISIPNLDTVTNSFPKLDMGLPGSGALVHDLPSTGAMALPHVEGLGTVSLPQVGHVALPQTGVSAMPSVSVPTLPHVNLSPVSATPVSGLSGSLAPGLGTHVGPTTAALGDLSLPTVSAQLTDLPALSPSGLSGPQAVGLGDGALVHVPDIGSVPVVAQIQAPHTGQIATPAGGAVGLGHVATPNLGGLPGVTHVATPATGALSNIAGVNTPHLGAIPNGTAVGLPNTGVVDLPTVHGGHGELSPTAPGAHPVGGKGVDGIDDATTHIDVNGSQVTLGTLTTGNGAGHVTPVGLGGTGAGHLLPRTPAADNLTVFMVNNVQYDFVHTFNGIPGLDGVEVRVAPSMRAGRTVDVHVDAGGRTGIDASHITVGDRQVLRIEQNLPTGGVRRWDYELSAQNNHQLLDDQIIDTHVTGPVPGQAVELTPLTTPQPPSTAITGTTALAGGTTVPTLHGPGTMAAPAPRLVDIPGLPGTRVEVSFGPGGGIQDIRAIGDANVRPSRVTRPTGNDLVRVEQTIVDDVETRRWDFDVSTANGRLLRIERHITLNGGDYDGTLVAVKVDVADNPFGVTHFGADGSILNPGGPPVRVDAVAVNIPTGTGFQLYDRTTGAPSHTGLQLVDSDGGKLPMHVMTPHNGEPHTLVADDATTSLGSVTAPANANGMFHVVPTDTGPAVRVFDADGRFSHESLPLTGIDQLHLAGGHIHSPHADTPHIAGPDGAPVPRTDVVPQLDHGFRVVHPGGQFHVDVAGARAHDVIPLTTAGGHDTGLHVFTPVNAANPLPNPRGLDGTPSTTATVANVDNTFHLTGIDARPHVVTVHTPQGAFSHNALPLTGGGGAPGGFIRLPDTVGGTPHLTRGDGTIVPNTSVTPQHGGGYLVQHGGGAIIVGDGGRYTHNVVELTAGGARLGQFVHTPVGTPHVPAPNPSSRGGIPDPDLTVTRVGNDLRLTDPNGSFTAHGLDGVRRYEAIHVLGGPFEGRFVRFDGHAGTLVDGHLAPVPDARVVRQTQLPGGGFRVGDGADHVVVGPQGLHRFDVVG
ncbi:hypothetical protein, partial [Streptomyces sp. SID3343]|uniref:hypothetical protein n=1 Tax=Streptomyces sp. SID3343 TaxID=2690260 RepID=UPI001367AF14